MLESSFFFLSKQNEYFFFWETNKMNIQPGHLCGYKKKTCKVIVSAQVVKLSCKVAIILVDACNTEHNNIT